MRRLAFAAVGLGLVACGIAYAPGDFLARDTITNDGGGIQGEAGATTPDASTAPTDAGVAGIHIMLIGGHRDAFAGERAPTDVAETMVATFSTLGELGPWTFDEPPPDPNTWTRAVISNGAVYVQGPTTFARASFTDHITSPWTTTPMIAIPQQGIRPWLLDGSGFHSGAAMSPSDILEPQWFEPIFPDGGVGLWAEGPALVAVARSDVTIVRLDNFAYVVGGRPSKPMPPLNNGAADVELAPVDPVSGRLGTFTETTPLTAGDAGSVGGSGVPYGVYLPVLGAGSGRVVVAGGIASFNQATLTSVVVAAHVSNPASGVLDPWVTLPPLPQPMKDFAIVVTVNDVLVFGGQTTAGNTVSDVLAVQVQSDGSYANAWTTIGHLPGPRSGLAAVTF